jgi:GNAT superfamily N-acetyltransferase
VKNKFSIIPLTKRQFNDAVELVIRAQLDRREEIEHHLQHFAAHYVAVDRKKVIGVIGWYQDNVHYADAAMGGKFPGEDAYWVGFFAVEPLYRGKKIGEALLKRLETVLKEKTISELWVSSVPETKSYYEKHGFTLIATGEIDGRQKFFLVKQLR